MRLKTLLLATTVLAISSIAKDTFAGPIIPHSLTETMVESRTGGQNFAAYSEGSPGFPNAWGNSAAKSGAPGVTGPTTGGIGSRFNSNAGIGGDDVWFQVAPTLPTAGGTYEVYVTVTHQSGNIDALSNITVTGGTGLPASTTAFSVSAAQPGNQWNLVGTLTLDPGVTTPSVRFHETQHNNRFYADSVLFAEIQLIPEPASFALAGLGLLGIAMTARRRNG